MNSFSSLKIVFIFLIISSISCAMQQSNDQIVRYNQKKAELIDLVTTGNNTLRAIATSGAISDRDEETLNKVANDIDESSSILDELIGKIKATHASNANDPKPKQITEDVLGDMLDVLEETPRILPLVLQIIDQAQHKNHPATRYNVSVAKAKEKVTKK